MRETEIKRDTLSLSQVEFSVHFPLFAQNLWRTQLKEYRNICCAGKFLKKSPLLYKFLRAFIIRIRPELSSTFPSNPEPLPHSLWPPCYYVAQMLFHSLLLIQSVLLKKEHEKPGITKHLFGKQGCLYIMRWLAIFIPWVFYYRGIFA